MTLTIASGWFIPPEPRGLPKPLVHGHGGIFLNLQKFLGPHVNVKQGETFFWLSTTGWVMWNILQGSLLLGATTVLYNGSPGYPDMDVLWLGLHILLEEIFRADVALAALLDVTRGVMG